MMWCTNCQTTFSWKTGKKTHEKVHNPHYYDYLRKNGMLKRDPLDVQCGGMPDANRLTIDCKVPWSLDVNLIVDTLRTYIRWLDHAREEETPFYPTTLAVDDFNTKLRVKFLMGEIDEPAWREMLYKNEKKHVLKKELGEILALVNSTSIDIIRRIHLAILDIQQKPIPQSAVNLGSWEEIVLVNRLAPRLAPYQRGQTRKTLKADKEMDTEGLAIFKAGIDELEALRSYANEHLQKVGVSFGCKFPQYGEHFEFLRYGIEKIHKP